jgi:photosystem II stability/assembly factor-like uncharacterized protein
MKKPYLFVCAAAILFIGSYFCFNTFSAAKEFDTGDLQAKEEKEEEEESGADKQLMMWFQSKGYPDASSLTGKYERAWEQYLQLRNERIKTMSRVQASNWTSLGQSFDNGGARIGGRILCIAIDPSNSNNLWAGSASGGIWKSTNAGTTWSPLTTDLPVLGVSSILIDPTNSNVMYAGTGEVYRVDTSNLGFNVWKTRGTYGIGIIKSEDGGLTWTQVLTKSSSQLFAIQEMQFDPTNSNTIYAAATDGLYRSYDAGETWTQIYAAVYVKDIEINPANTEQVVISTGNMLNPNKGIYRTTNASSATPTFTKITSGLPASFEGSITLDHAGTVLMASIGISSSTAASNREIYSSSNFGSTWNVVGGTTAGTTTNHSSYQFWFAHVVAVNPFHTDSLLFGGVGLYRYQVSTTSRTTVSGVHADHHDIKFDPVNRGRIYVCNDGGIYKSTNGGVTFSAINNGLNATQFYASLGVSRTDANVMAGGLQDNGQVLFNGSVWNQVTWAGGDGTSCAIDPNNDNRILVSRDARQVYRSIDGGGSGGAVSSYWGFVADSRTAFVAPVAFSKTRPDSVYIGTDNLHISTNGGGSFSDNAYSTATNYIEALHKTAITLAVSPTNSQKLYVSTSPFAQYDNDNNNIHVTGQPNILKTTTGNTPFTSIKGSLPDRFIMDMAISPTYDDSVFVALGGFGTSHIYVTGNGGSTWTARSAGLPDVPFNAIVFDPLNPKIIYAGCDFGVYVSGDRGQTWVDYNSGFWDATLVMDLQISADNKLIAATHGKGVFKTDLYSGGTLPAKLIDFGGVNRGNYNQLHWVMAEEIDIQKYELERSADGMNYQTVAVKQPMNSLGQTTYTHNDMLTTGVTEYYYRVKIFEADGSFNYSSVILIRSAHKTKISVYNNPFHDVILLQYNIARDQQIAVALYTSNGALVRKQDFRATAGSGVYSMYGFGHLPTGMYLLKAESAGFTETIKLIKR